jgi:hypothetical protein
MYETLHRHSIPLMKLYDILWEKTIKYHFPDDGFNVFGIQCSDVAEAVLKNNGRVDFGAVSESRWRLAKSMLPLFSTTMRAFFSRPSRNFKETAWQDDDALFLKDNARIVFGAVSASHVKDPPNRLRRWIWKNMSGIFKGLWRYSARDTAQNSSPNIHLCQKCLHLTMRLVMVPCSGVR